MKNYKISLLLSLIVLMISACQHDILDELEEDLMIDEDFTDSLYNGTFMSANRYEVSGMAELVTHNGEKRLILRSFSSSSGPGLKVYISQEKSPSGHTDLGDLKALSGNFSYTLPDHFDFNDNGPYVLIYCEPFSVLFGSAELKMTN